jgi:hypothetical protein
MDPIKTCTTRPAPVIASLILVLAAMNAVADPRAHAQWCFDPSTDNRLVDQPMDRGSCAALLVAGAALAYFSGNDELASLIVSSRQNDWARKAASISCIGGDIGNQMAIRLIQACQCHNPGAQSEIENNQTEVLEVLRSNGGC